MPSAISTIQPLTRQQFAILHTLYRFRFITNPLAAAMLRTSKQRMHYRLKALVDQGYIGRHFEPRYRLLGKPAAYYLLPKGVAALRAVPDSTYDSSVLRNLRHDQHAGQQFINHSLAVLDIYCRLETAHRGQLELYTKSEVTTRQHFPNPLPDLYLRLNVVGSDSQLFVEYIQQQPLRTIDRFIENYLRYFEISGWKSFSETSPAVLIVCASPPLSRLVHRQVRKRLENWYEEEPSLYITTPDKLEPDSLFEIQPGR